MIEHVVLVDETDEILGIEEKMKAHQEGLLHRAFSVFIFRRGENSNIEFLLQQRHPDKYHCGGLWTNTCCSHPRLNEEVHLAGRRRLKEEMSLDLPLIPVGTFLYRAFFQNGLIEHELDHVLIGEFKHDSNYSNIEFDPEEVANFSWKSLEDLEQELQIHPELYTPWFKPALKLAWEGICHNF